MNKAYDRLEWGFLENVMLRMNFCETWVKWIMRCVRSVQFSVQLSGRVVSQIDPQRGLRQGDPLSPYLFILASEVLSAMMNCKTEQGEMRGIKLARGSSKLTHCIMFADDTIVFLRATRDNCENFIHILNAYCSASGQQINLEKSNLFFSSKYPTTA